MCVLILIKNNNFKTYGCLNVTFYTRDYEKEQGFTLEEFLSTKKIIDFNLTGNEIKDINLLNKYQLAVRNLTQTKDSINCIRLKFCKKSKYKDFVKAIEVCKIENAKFYSPFENNLWVTNGSRDDFKKAHPPRYEYQRIGCK